MFHTPYYKVPADQPQAGQIHDDPRPRSNIAAIIPIGSTTLAIRDYEVENAEQEAEAARFERIRIACERPVPYGC